MYKSLDRKLGLEPGTVSHLLSVEDEARYTMVTRKRKRSLLRRKRTEDRLRDILIPSEDLKAFQKRIHMLLSTRFRPSKIAHAYVEGRSIITNALQHLHASEILKIDFENYFGQLDIIYVINGLKYYLPDFNMQDIRVIAELCCFRGDLPHGSPASPILSNIICEVFDDELEKLVQSFGCVVTRFSDDITISTKSGRLPSEFVGVDRFNRQSPIELGPLLRSFIEEDHGFKINLAKLRFQARAQGLRVTGLLLTDRVDVPNEYRRNLKAVLHQWRTHGLEFAAGRRPLKNFVRALNGNIAFLGQVRGLGDRLYRDLSASFEDLLDRDGHKVLGWRNCN